MTITTIRLAIYVASLSDYNNSVLHGAWIELNGKDFDDVMDEIQEMLKNSPTAKETGEPAEEWAIHDYEFPVGLSEYENIKDVVNTAIVFDEVNEPEALAEYMDYMGFDLSEIDDARDKFEETYRGQYDDKADFAEEYAEETGILDSIPDNLRGYFDYEAFARDLFIDGFFMTDSGHVFSDR